jgi:endo-1,4-beta-xylanase
MKKATLIVLAVLALVAVLGCASAAPAAKEEKKADAAPAPAGPMTSAVAGTATVDGVKDAIYDKAPVVETVLTTIGDAKTSHAKAQLVWDANALYAFVEVKDPVLSDKNANAWEQDSVEVYIDEKNTKSATYVAGVAQYRVNFKNVASGGSGAKMSAFKSAAKVVDGGFIVELAIPFTLGAPKAGTIIGFDLQTNDDGKGDGVRSGIKDWANTTNNNYQNASKFGNCKLN